MRKLALHDKNPSQNGLPPSEASNVAFKTSFGSSARTGGSLILHVEDNEIYRETIRQLLENHGFSVHTAGNGDQAISALKKQRYDLVLMDIQMPEMDGFEATRRIRISKSGGFDPAIPIIALSSLVYGNDKRDFLEKGFTSCLSKFCSTGEIINEIELFIPIHKR